MDRYIELLMGEQGFSFIFVEYWIVKFTNIIKN